MASLVIYTIPLVVAACLVIVLANGSSCLHRYWRTWRFQSGHPNRPESAMLALLAERRQTVAQAQAVARDLAGPHRLDLGRPWGLNLGSNERVLFHGPSGYARYYGMSTTYSQTSGFFYGSPLFVVAGLGLTAVANRSRRNAAVRLAAEQWRELQVTEYVVTEQRVLVHHVDGRWLTFDFSAVVSFYPRLENETVFLEFSDAEPLRIQGPASDVTSVVAVWHAHGSQGLREHPGLAPLRVPTPVGS